VVRSVAKECVATIIYAAMSGDQKPTQRPSFIAAAPHQKDDGARTDSFLDPIFPSEAIQHVLSFLDFADRQTLTTTHNKRALREVETYSQKLYEAIKRKHRVDETFDARVCDQSNLQPLITKREKPIFVPYRYRVVKSLKTWLYKIEIGDIEMDFRHQYVFRLSPSEHRFVVSAAASSGTTPVFDVSTRQRVTNLEHAHRCNDVLLLDDNRIVTFNRHRGNMCIWTECDSGNWNDEAILELQCRRRGICFCLPQSVSETNFFP